VPDQSSMFGHSIESRAIVDDVSSEAIHSRTSKT
jgi:hypothetical protein